MFKVSHQGLAFIPYTCMHVIIGVCSSQMLHRLLCLYKSAMNSRKMNDSTLLVKITKILMGFFPRIFKFLAYFFIIALLY